MLLLLLLFALVSADDFQVIVAPGAHQLSITRLWQAYKQYFFKSFSPNLIKMLPTLPNWTPVYDQVSVLRAIEALDLSTTAQCLDYPLWQVSERNVKAYLITDRPPCNMTQATFDASRIVQQLGGAVYPVGIGVNLANIAGPCPSGVCVPGRDYWWITVGNL